jgi:hypothetical protein
MGGGCGQGMLCGLLHCKIVWLQSCHCQCIPDMGCASNALGDAGSSSVCCGGRGSRCRQHSSCCVFGGKGGGAGSLSGWCLYGGNQHHGACYALTFTVHTANACLLERQTAAGAVHVFCQACFDLWVLCVGMSFCEIDNGLCVVDYCGVGSVWCKRIMFG